MSDKPVLTQFLDALRRWMLRSLEGEGDPPELLELIRRFPSRAEVVAPGGVYVVIGYCSTSHEDHYHLVVVPAGTPIATLADLAAAGRDARSLCPGRCHTISELN